MRARRVGPLGRAWRWCRRKPAVAAQVAALTLALIGGLVTSLLLWRRAVAGEAQALANLHQEEVARQEAEDHFAMIRDVLDANVIFTHWSFFAPAPNDLPVRTGLLLKAEACYASLLRKRDQDRELRRLYAQTLRYLGQIALDKGDRSEALALLDKGARLFSHLPAAGMRAPDSLDEGVRCYLFLGIAHEQSGNRESANQAIDTCFRLWQALSEEQPSGNDNIDAFFSGVYLAGNLLRFGHSEADILHRFERWRPRLALPDNAPACDLIDDLLLPMARWQSKHDSTIQAAESLALSREVATVLERFYQHLPSERKARLSIHRCSILISPSLRKGGALNESLHLLDQASRDLQKLCQEEPAGHYYFRELSRSWYEISKFHWKMEEIDNTLTACRRALEAQQQALALAPSVRQYRDELGSYHLRLGRKYCELGRLDEAEACFQQRQALWPGDVGKHEEALREVRRWAKGVGDGKKGLTPEEQQERQRYLDLCARLESKGPTTAAMTEGANQ